MYDELREIVVVDFETTGAVKGQENLPWQIGCARLHNGEVLPGETLSIYLKVPEHHHFNPYAPGRWADVREMLSTCHFLPEEWPRLSPWLSGALAAHNVPVERSMLNRFFPLHQFGPWIDTLRIARQAYPGLKDYSLSTLLAYFSLEEKVQGLCPGLAAHDACYDAVGCACLLQYFMNLPGWKEAQPEVYFC